MSDKDEPKILPPNELEILLGLPILRLIVKEDLDPSVIEIRNAEGNTIHRIVNIGTVVEEKPKP